MKHNRVLEFDTIDTIIFPESYYKNLIVQIIIQAKKDYCEALKKFDSKDVKSVETFFSSHWFKFLLGNLNLDISPEEFFSRFKKNFLSYRRVYFMKKIFDDITIRTRYYNLNEHEILSLGFSLLNYYNNLIYKAIEQDKLTEQETQEKAADGVVNFMEDYLAYLDKSDRQISVADETNKKDVVE